PFSYTRAALSQLPAVFRRAERLVDWNVDDAHRHQLAGLPAHRISNAAWTSRLRRTTSYIPIGSVCRRVGGPLEPPPRSCGHAGAGDAAVLCSCRARAHWTHHGL